MKLVIMTKPTFFVEEDKILASLFDEGMDSLHLYKPGSAPLYSERLLTLLPEDVYGKIMVHGHLYLKEEYGLRGIHIDSEEEMPAGYRGRFSRTCRLLDELKVAGKRADCVFLDHTFDIKADGSGERVFSDDELCEASRKGFIDRKVYAYGNIGLDSVQKAKDLGFGGVVVGNDLWDRFDIHRQQDYKELMAHFEKLRKAVG